MGRGGEGKGIEKGEEKGWGGAGTPNLTCLHNAPEDDGILSHHELRTFIGLVLDRWPISGVCVDVWCLCSVAEQTYPSQCRCHNNFSRTIRCNGVGFNHVPSQLKMSGSINRLYVSLSDSDRFHCFHSLYSLDFFTVLHHPRVRAVKRLRLTLI